MSVHIVPAHTFSVRPALPDPIIGLQDLAYNLWWAWRLPARDLFRRLDPDAWQATLHNPVAMLSVIPRERLAARAADAAFVAELQREHEALMRYLQRAGELTAAGRPLLRGRVAYFSMEFGITESVPQYSGGLGVLAGDHLKASSDLGVPVVGVGMLYRQGCFRQWIDAAGQQRERFPDNDFYSQPV
ncbi:MAG: DUF3417 domain-containing protein [Actinobacteria bacterium]|nr:DUF3417 domain-containing protein [Actinomycetota bacterium]